MLLFQGCQPSTISRILNSVWIWENGDAQKNRNPTSVLDHVCVHSLKLSAPRSSFSPLSTKRSPLDQGWQYSPILYGPDDIVCWQKNREHLRHSLSVEWSSRKILNIGRPAVSSEHWTLKICVRSAPSHCRIRSKVFVFCPPIGSRPLPVRENYENQWPILYDAC